MYLYILFIKICLPVLAFIKLLHFFIKIIFFTVFIVYICLKLKEMKSQKLNSTTGAKAFPGPPLGMGLIIPIKIKQTAEFLNKGDERSQKLGKIMFGIFDAMTKNDDSYFKLYEKIGEIYPKMSKFWNDEVFHKMNNKSGIAEVGDVKKITGIDFEKLVSGIDPEGFNYLQATIMFIKNVRNHAQKETADDIERCEILYPMLWSVYISVFKDEYLDEILEIVYK